MATIVDFFVEVLHDPDKHRRSFTELDQLMEESELSQGQKTAIMSGDPLRLQHVIEYELNLAPGERLAIWILFIPPPPPPRRC